MKPALAIVALLALSQPALAQTVPGAQLRVIDGDTVTLGPEKIRLLGIDAPETYRARCPAERVAGRRATLALKRLLAGQQVRIARDGTDRYGRTLAHLFIVTGAGATDIGDELLASGNAVLWRPGSRAWLQRRAHWCGKASQ